MLNKDKQFLLSYLILTVVYVIRELYKAWLTSLIQEMTPWRYDAFPLQPSLMVEPLSLASLIRTHCKAASLTSLSLWFYALLKVSSILVALIITPRPMTSNTGRRSLNFSVSSPTFCSTSCYHSNSTCIKLKSLFCFHKEATLRISLCPQWYTHIPNTYGLVLPVTPRPVWESLRTDLVRVSLEYSSCFPTACPVHLERFIMTTDSAGGVGCGGEHAGTWEGSSFIKTQASSSRVQQDLVPSLCTSRPTVLITLWVFLSGSPCPMPERGVRARAACRTGGGCSSTPGHLGVNVPFCTSELYSRGRTWAQWLRALCLWEAVWHL